MINKLSDNTVAAGTATITELAAKSANDSITMKTVDALLDSVKTKEKINTELLKEITVLKETLVKTESKIKDLEKNGNEIIIYKEYSTVRTVNNPYGTIVTSIGSPTPNIYASSLKGEIALGKIREEVKVILEKEYKEKLDKVNSLELEVKELKNQLEFNSNSYEISNEKTNNEHLLEIRNIKTASRKKELEIERLYSSWKEDLMEKYDSLKKKLDFETEKEELRFYRKVANSRLGRLFIRKPKNA